MRLDPLINANVREYLGRDEPGLAIVRGFDILW